jgi:hypothetical protein
MIDATSTDATSTSTDASDDQGVCYDDILQNAYWQDDVLICAT